jgi:hypothetical protein
MTISIAQSFCVQPSSNLIAIQLFLPPTNPFILLRPASRRELFFTARQGLTRSTIGAVLGQAGLPRQRNSGGASGVFP